MNETAMAARPSLVHVAALFGVAVTVAGCAGAPFRETAHLDWTPGYCGDRHLLIYGAGAWTEQTIQGLLWRLGYQQYWELARLVIEHGRDADYAVIAEYIPADPLGEENYWFCLLVQKRGKYRFYSTAGLPQNNPWMPLHDGEPYDRWKPLKKVDESLKKKSSGGVPVVGGPVKDATLVREFLNVLASRDICDYGLYRAIWGDEGKFSNKYPWLIHIYDPHNERTAQFAGDVPMLDPDVIMGHKKLEDVPEMGDPGPTELVCGGWRSDDLHGPHAELIRSEYDASYPIRLLLNGLLRLAVAVQEKK